VLKVMTYLASRRGIVLVALSVGAAVLNAKGHPGLGFGDLGW
jgi:hypothetical protein